MNMQQHESVTWVWKYLGYSNKMHICGKLPEILKTMCEVENKLRWPSRITGELWNSKNVLHMVIERYHSNILTGFPPTYYCFPPLLLWCWRSLKTIWTEKRKAQNEFKLQAAWILRGNTRWDWIIWDTFWKSCLRYSVIHEGFWLSKHHLFIPTDHSQFKEYLLSSPWAVNPGHLLLYISVSELQKVPLEG